jgi:Protocatechuate 3,4-dioxygenase beta subunit
MYQTGLVTMSPRSRLRRQLVLGGTAALVSAPLAAAQRTLTPSQMLGPFYPVTPPLHKDNDLTQVEGRSARAAGRSPTCRAACWTSTAGPLAGLRVEIWQCDANGRYRHPRDPAASRRTRTSRASATPSPTPKAATASAPSARCPTRGARRTSTPR